MSKSYRGVLIVLIAPLLLAVGCVNAQSLTRKLSFPSDPPETLSDAPAQPIPAQPNERTTESLGYEDMDSLGLVSVGLETNAIAETPRVEESLEPADLASQPMPLQEVKFASVAALDKLATTGPVDLASIELIPTELETSPEPMETEVEQAGCRLFHEDPPLQRECIDLGLGNVSSIIHPCGMRFLAPYLDRVSDFEDINLNNPDDNNPVTGANCPPSAWWEDRVVASVRPDSMTIPLDIEALLVRTLANSKYLQGLADLPLIRERSTMEAIAEFDVSTFVESRFLRASEPVGNQLTVGPGGSSRFREKDFSTSAGIARKTSSGARVQLAQQAGLLTNNSQFIDPRYQGNTQLTLNLTQPLLSGKGKAYNTSLIMLAQMDERVAWDEVSEQLQEYLVEVTENYWQLYLQRARLHQKERHLEHGEEILAELEQRQEIDAVSSQIARARAAVQNRKAELIRAKTEVRNVESRLRGLINDPELYGSAIELLPTEVPHCTPMQLSLGDAMSQALQSRSEVDKAIQKVRAAGVRLDVAKNELLPILDLVLETYLSGLRGRNNVGQAWVDQFSVGEPSYSAGFRYEIPLNNRLAKNRHDRRRLEMRQAISQFEFEVEGLMSEVDIAVREVETTYQEMLSRYEAMVASETDLSYFRKRWELLPGDDRSASFLLEDIIEAQDRVYAQESNYAQSQVNYAMSIVNLKRALGILMQTERIETARECEDCLEKYSFNKNTLDLKSFQADATSPVSPSDDAWIQTEELSTMKSGWPSDQPDDTHSIDSPVMIESPLLNSPFYQTQ